MSKKVHYQSKIAHATFEGKASKEQLKALEDLTKKVYLLPIDSTIKFIDKK